MATQRTKLATILILSAIDVLLCSYTAALTLFLIAAGADAASSEQVKEAEESIIESGGNYWGAGSPAAIIIATYNTGSARLQPPPGGGYSTLPPDSWQKAPAVLWLVNEAPTDRTPFVLQGDTGPIEVTLDLAIDGRTLRTLLHCAAPGPVKVFVSETLVRTNRTDCYFTGDGT